MKKLIFTSIFTALVLTSCTLNRKKTYNTAVINEVVADLKIPKVQLLKENKPLACRMFRLRVLKFLPGTKTDIHSHEDRPETFGIIEGDQGVLVHVYNRNSLIVPYAGADVSYTNVIHYAENLSKTKTMLMMVSDLLDDGSECNGKIYPQYTPLLDKLKKENDSFYANSPHAKEGDISSIGYFSTQISQIRLPEGTTPIKDRSIRIRKVRLEKDATIKEQDYSNRPTYIMVINGKIAVTVDNAPEKEIGIKQGVNLVNVGKVNIKNATQADAIYFVIELWDPNDGDII